MWDLTLWGFTLKPSIVTSQFFSDIQDYALISPTSGGRSVGIVRSRTKATEFSLVQLLSQNTLPQNYWEV
jgi:hypothetical protein